MIGDPSIDVTSGSAASGRYLVLDMDGLRLLIPQSQVHALEPAFDVQHPDAGGVGWITVAGERSPVYCLSQDLRPLREHPASRHVCVLLNSDAGLFGVLCDQVSMFEGAAPEITPLPACMRDPDTPLRGLLLHGEQVLCVGSAEDLLVCLDEDQALVREGDGRRLAHGGAV